MRRPRRVAWRVKMVHRRRIMNVADIWVDSVNGDDANDGTTELTAFQTLAAATTEAESLGGNVNIALVGGSEWRVTAAENLRPTGLSGLDVRGYLPTPTTPLPHLNCLQVLANASFTKTVGQTNVYEIAVAHDMSGVEYVLGYEDGTGLTATASTAACDALAGSYHTTNTTATGQTLYIHPRGSTNPTSDGKVYEATATGQAIGINDGYPCRCEKLSFTGAGHKDSPIGKLATGSNKLIVRKMHIHHLLGTGAYSDLVLYEPQDVTPRGLSGCNPFVGYAPVEEGTTPAAELDSVYVHSTFAVQAYLQHTLGGTLVGGHLRNFYSHYGSIFGSPAEVTNCFIRMPVNSNISHPLATYEAATITNVVYIDCRGFISNLGDGVVTVNDCRLHHSDSSGPTNSGYFVGDVIVTNSTLVSPTGEFTGIFEPGNVNSMESCIVFGTRNILTETTNNPPTAMDNNVYYASGENQWWTNNNVLYTNLAAWQAAPPGLDGNSAQADPLLADPANNDWTFTGASPADASGRAAGSRSHIAEPDWAALIAGWDQHFLMIDGHEPA